MLIMINHCICATSFLCKVGIFIRIISKIPLIVIFYMMMEQHTDPDSIDILTQFSFWLDLISCLCLIFTVMTQIMIEDQLMGLLYESIRAIAVYCILFLFKYQQSPMEMTWTVTFACLILHIMSFMSLSYDHSYFYQSESIMYMSTYLFLASSVSIYVHIFFFILSCLSNYLNLSNSDSDNFLPFIK